MAAWQVIASNGDRCNLQTRVSIFSGMFSRTHHLGRSKMDGKTTLDFWQLATLAIVPSMLAGIVAMSLPFLQEWAKSFKERRKQKIEKLEEAIYELYRHGHWVDLRRSTVAFGIGTEESQPPLDRVRAIVYLFFPQFKRELIALSAASSAYELKMTEASVKRLNREIENLAVGLADPGYHFLVAQNALLDSMEKYALALFSEN